MSKNSQAILWALLASALYSVAIVMAKFAVSQYHILQILFFRQIVLFASSLPGIAKAFPESLKTERPRIHALRLAGAFIALSFGIWGVAVLPLTTATTLAFAQVFFVALLAFWFLNEPVGPQRLIAILVGLIGVVIVMRPGVTSFFDPHTLIPVVGALGAAIAIASVRKLSQTESSATLLVYQSIFVGVLAGVPLIWLWTTPDLHGLMLLLTMGVLATIGQWIGVKALRLGEASVVGSIEYSKLIYTAIFGYALFDEVPSIYTIIGACIIIGSSLYIFHREG